MSNQGFIGDNFSQSEIPGSGMPAGIGRTNTLDIEQIDSIINNPKEHPDIRQNAIALKARLFPEESIQEDIKIEPKLVAKKPNKMYGEKTQSNINFSTAEIKSNQVSDNDFAKFLSEFKTDLYVGEVQLLSNPEVPVNLKSMTVDEYKFLSRQMEMFETKVKILETSDDIDNKRRNINITEFNLNNALDTILSRCISNNINVKELTSYDWIYLLLNLRVISRGEDCTLLIRSPNNIDTKIKVNVNEMVEYIAENREYFSDKIIETIPVNDNLSICIVPITRGDLNFVQKSYIGDKEASIAILNAAMSVKAFIRDGVANIMTPQQRVQLTNTLPYTVIEKIMKVYDKNDQRFFEVINNFVKYKYEDVEGIEAVDISDFILFFYDF